VRSEIELVPEELIRGRLIVADGYVDLSDGDAQFGYQLPILKDACQRGLDPFNKTEREIWYQRIRDLIVEGADEAWFCLSILAYQSGPLFPATDGETTEGARVAATLIQKILRWWPTFVALSHRFQLRDTINVPPKPSDSWMNWGQVLVRLCTYFQMPDEEWMKLQELSAIEISEEVGRLAETVLARCPRSD
jgi:hypothetical protein